MKNVFLKAFGIEPPMPAAALTHELVAVPIVRPRVPLMDTFTTAPQMGYLDRASDKPRNGFGPSLRTADLDVRGAWGAVTGNVRSITQNSGWIAGAVDQFVAYAVGNGLTPNIEPAYDLIGWDHDFAKDWAKRVERLFADWADDPQVADDRRVHTFGQLQAAALRSWFSTGDVMAAVVYEEKRQGYRTSILGIDPVRVLTPPPYLSGRSKSFFDGIELDPAGRPLAYWLAPIAGAQDPSGTRIPAHGANGRQIVAHAFIGGPGQVRGISPFASVVQAMSQAHGLFDAMTVAAHAAASVIGTVTSDLPSADVARGMVASGDDPLGAMMGSQMAARASWHETLNENKANITLGGQGRVFHLTTGERFELHAGKDHYANFPEHLKALLREISRAAGLPYEMFSGDRSAANYSSGRMGLLDFWSLVELRRSTLIEPLCRLALQSVVEEFIARRYIDYPGGLRAFRAQKTLALKARWFGPSRPSVDELKSVRASVERLEAGLTSLAEESAALGSDWETTMQQRSHEATTAERFNVPLASHIPTKEGGSQ